MCRVLVNGQIAAASNNVGAAQVIEGELKARMPDAIVYLELDEVDRINLQEQGFEPEYKVAHAACEAARAATPVSYRHYFQRMMRRQDDGWQWAWQLR